MAVQTFSLPEGNCPAGSKTVSPSTLMNNNPIDIEIKLTSSEWDAKAGLGSVRWGVERSPDGVAWEEWIVPSPPVPIGMRVRGHMPSVGLSGGVLAGLVGYRVRLFGQPAGVDIKLGADFAVTT